MPKLSPTSSRPSLSLRVLYVEDHEAIRVVVAGLLEGCGHVVDTAADGVEGWQKIRLTLDDAKSHPPYDLVLTDLDMPRMSGLDFIRMLRSARFSGRIVVHSAALTLHCMEKLDSLSVDAALPKDIAPRDLVETIEKVTCLRY